MNPAGLAAGQAKAPEPESKEQKQLEIRAGSRLMPSIRSWLQAAGYELTWSAPSGVVGRIRDIELTEDFTSESADVRDVLTQVLAPFAFEAEVIEAPSRRRVIVRNARPNL
jgi:ethanolamine utilization cobalamin adenosyltransferase